jgi:hypothetical protein
MRCSHLELLRADTHEADAELRRRGLLRGSTSRQRRGDYCEALVARHLNGILAPQNNPSFDLTCPRYGRVEVKARGLDSVHQNWYHVRGLGRCGFDHLVAVEVHADWTVAGAWLLSFDEVVEFRHRRRDGRDVEPTKLRMNGSWKHEAATLELGPTQRAIA